MNLTSKDIEALREYMKKLETLDKERANDKNIMTSEDWDEAWEEIRKTGKIPDKYKGRIAERETRISSALVNGIPQHIEGGRMQKTYYDAVKNSYIQRYNQLQEEYHDPIVKLFQSFLSDEHGEGTQTTIAQMLQEAVERIQAAEAPRVLDIANLPNLLPTDKRLQYAITPLRNEYAYIMPFDYKKLRFDYDENGEIIIGTEAQYKAVEEAKDEKRKIEAAGIDQPLLRQLFAATMKAHLCNYGNSITVYLPSFAREMGIDVHYSNLKAEERTTGNKADIPKHNSNDFFKKLEALEKLNGVWEGGSFYRVFVLEGYEADQNTLTFSSPWLFKIARELLQTPANKKTKSDGSIMWEITGISTLMKPSIVSARSKPTVEIIATLLAGLQQYGTKTEAKRHPGRKYKDKDLVEYDISFKTLIERIPLIMENLDSCKPSNKTTLLQRYFCGSNFKKRQKEGRGYILEEYIREHTFLLDYYKDFEIVFQPPTLKTLSDKIIIRHHGINGNFKANNALNEIIFQEAHQTNGPEEKDA